MAKTNVVLYGFMGTGKSAVARCLAQTYGMEPIDTDAMIEEAEGATIAQVFGRRGEIYFRAVEREAVRKAAERSDAAIATGGGVPMDPANVAALSATGVGILLRAPVDVIIRRLGTPEGRPVLRGRLDQDHVAQLLARRQEAYRQFGHVIDTGDLTVPEVARRAHEVFLSVKDAGPRRRVRIS